MTTQPLQQTTFSDWSTGDIFALDFVTDFLLVSLNESPVRLLWRDIDPDDRHININNKKKAIEYFREHPGTVEVGQPFNPSDCDAGIELRVANEENLKQLQQLVKTELALLLQAEKTGIELARDTSGHFPYTLPRGTKWGQIWIEFTDEEIVIIHAKTFPAVTQNYKDMGFMDGRTKNSIEKSNRLWAFFVVLAKAAGEIIPGEIDTKAMESLKKLNRSLLK